MIPRGVDRKHVPKPSPLLVLLAAFAVALIGAGASFGAVGYEAKVIHEPIIVVELDGGIDRVSAGFLERAIDQAAEESARVIVIRLDTPGGLLDATRDMVADIFASSVPVAVYVAPEGAQAASAGTFVGASAALLAMAPATNIGAASVVGGGGEDLPETLGRKVTEDATAFIRSIAERRGRAVEPLEATVLEAVAYSAEEAVELGIADLIASDLGDLLAQIDGRTLAVADGEVTVSTEDAPLRTIEMNFFERVLSFLADPNIAFLLISLGSLALVIELFSPGLWIPGTVGVLALILGFAGVGNLPFSWASVALFAVALILFVAETQAPGLGFFGLAGVVALVLAGLFLVGFFGPPELPGVSVGVNRWVLIGVGAGVGLVVLAFVREVRRSQKEPGYVSPLAQGSLLGRVGEVTARLDPEGEVRVAGETWSAHLVEGGPAELGERVRVTAMKDVQLLVERVLAGDSVDDATTPARDDATRPGRTS